MAGEWNPLQLYVDPAAEELDLTEALGNLADAISKERFNAGEPSDLELVEIDGTVYLEVTITPDMESKSIDGAIHRLTEGLGGADD